MNALVLAGGESSPELFAATGCGERALIEIGERACVLRVLDALRAAKGIEKIAVVGSAQVLDVCEEGGQIVRVPAGISMTQNFSRGMNALKNEGIAALIRAGKDGVSDSANSAQVLVCTCDIPLISAQTFETFIEATTQKKLELSYPIVKKNVSERAFPGGQRTYVKLTNGEFTGGNAVVVPLRLADKVNVLLEAAYKSRKNPLSLAKLLGPKFVWKFVRKSLSIAEVEEAAHRVLDCRVGAVEMTDATISFDVDKVADWKKAAFYLEKINA